MGVCFHSAVFPLRAAKRRYVTYVFALLIGLPINISSTMCLKLMLSSHDVNQVSNEYAHARVLPSAESDLRARKPREQNRFAHFPYLDIFTAEDSSSDAPNGYLPGGLFTFCDDVRWPSSASICTFDSVLLTDLDY